MGVNHRVDVGNGTQVSSREQVLDTMKPSLHVFKTFCYLGAEDRAQLVECLPNNHIITGLSPQCCVKRAWGCMPAILAHRR